jgi:hypothetical protein
LFFKWGGSFFLSLLFFFLPSMFDEKKESAGIIVTSIYIDEINFVFIIKDNKHIHLISIAVSLLPWKYSMQIKSLIDNRTT